jgi:hypothetical protein
MGNQDEVPATDEPAVSPSRRFTENLRSVTPQGRDPDEFAHEFLDRYMADDPRVVGVRFGPTTIEVAVTDRATMHDLPAAFDGVPVVLRDWPPRG